VRQLVFTALLLALCTLGLAALGLTGTAAADGMKKTRTVEAPAPLGTYTPAPAPHPRGYSHPPRTYSYTTPTRRYAHPPKRTYRTVTRSAPATTTRIVTQGPTYTRQVTTGSCRCAPARATTRYISPGSYGGPYSGGVGYDVGTGGVYGGGSTVIVGGTSGGRSSYVLSAPAARFAFQRRGGGMGGKRMGGGCH